MIEQIGDGIWKTVGQEPGPIIVVFGGIHGNELTGIEVVRMLRAQMESGALSVSCGTLYLIFGNPKAIARNTRGSEDHADLNRCFKRDVLDSVPETYEQSRAQEIAKILATADISIDLHATNKPSVPFLCCLADESHKKIFQWFDCDRVLADPRYILAGEPVTTDEFIDVQGGFGVCYETGFVGDLTRVDSVYENVLNVLRDQGLISSPISKGNMRESRRIFELTERINLTEAGFRYADEKGKGSFEEFKQGDVLAYVGDEPFVASYDGVIIFPKIQEHWKIDHPVMYLGKMV